MYIYHEYIYTNYHRWSDPIIVTFNEVYFQLLYKANSGRRRCKHVVKIYVSEKEYICRKCKSPS